MKQRPHRLTTAAGALAALLLLVGCGTGTPGDGIASLSSAPSGADGSAPTRSTSGPSASSGLDAQQLARLSPDTLVLRVSHSGGMTAPGAWVGRVPQLSIYADGRVITEGPTMAIYPGPALPNLQQAHIPRDEVVSLLDAVVAAGVDGTKRDWGSPRVSDAGNTDVTVRTAKGPVSASVYALEEASIRPRGGGGDSGSSGGDSGGTGGSSYAPLGGTGAAPSATPLAGMSRSDSSASTSGGAAVGSAGGSGVGSAGGSGVGSAGGSGVGSAGGSGVGTVGSGVGTVGQVGPVATVTATPQPAPTWTYDDGLTPDQRQRRGELLTAIDKAQATGTSTTGYTATEGAVIAQPYPAPDKGLPAGMVHDQDWRGPNPASGDTAGLPEGWHCLALDAKQWPALRPSLADSNQLTRWHAGGGTWRFVVRPLLPDEHGCADLR